MRKQTSIEWLVEQYEKAFTLKINTVMTSIIEQAGQMHKQEIVAAFNTADNLHYTKGADLDIDGHEYYNETFKSNIEEKEAN